MKTSIAEELSKRIERVIQDHIAECRQAAQAALCRAFAAPVSGAKAPVSARAKAKPGGRESNPRQRRTADELSVIADKLYEAVCAGPGDTMAALALRLGVPSQELQKPMAVLKRGEKVRHVGERSQTRYFPLAAGTA